MRLATIIALALSIALATFSANCDAKSGRNLAFPDEEDEFPRRLYREYTMRRAARADDTFKDYGHLRFGRSDED